MPEDDDPIVELLVNGKHYSIDLSDIDGPERRAFRLATGVKLHESDELDEYEFIAGLVWLVKRREDDSITFEDVLKTMKRDSLDDPEEEKPADPPA